MSSQPGPAQLDIQQLYRSYGGLVRARIRRFYQGEEAEDVLQEVFMRAMEKLDTFRGESAPSTWLYQLTTRYCLNRLRDASRRRELIEEQDGVWWSKPSVGVTQESRLLLEQIWQGVDEETALIAVSYYVDGMTREDVAALVGCSVRTVGYRLEALKKKAQERAGS